MDAPCVRVFQGEVPLSSDHKSQSPWPCPGKHRREIDIEISRMLRMDEALPSLRRRMGCLARWMAAMCLVMTAAAEA